MSDSKQLTFKKIFIFWMPLAITWLMMSIEGPYLSAIIARMPNPKFNLAAYGVAFSFALLIESPVIMIMSAATALVKDYFSFQKLKIFIYTLNIAITVLMLIILIPEIFDFIAIDLIQLPKTVAGITHTSLIILLPWPAAIGYRRFYQGILISNDLTRKVAYGTIIRLSTMSITALLLYLYSNLDGAVVGAFALSVGVIFEGIASKLMSLGILKKIKKGEINQAESKPLNYFSIVKFYYPMAMTSILSLGVHPIVTFFLGQSRMSLESLAVLPVINSLVFIFRSVGLSYHEVVIALLGENREGYKPLRNFGTMLGFSVVFLLAVITTTPLSEIWFHYISGLSQTLTEFAFLPAMILTILPGLTVLISIQRAILVYSRNTSPLTYATLIEVVGILLVLFIGIKYFDLVGVVAAAIAFIFGRFLANLFLMKPYNKSVNSFS